MSLHLRPSLIVVVLAPVLVAARPQPAPKAPPDASPAMDAMERRIDALEGEQTNARAEVAALRQRLRATEERAAALAKDHALLASSSAANARQTSNGTIILIIGLAIELLGATMLAWPSITAVIVDVPVWRSSAPLIDIPLRDPDRDHHADFLGTLGAMLLAFGFLVQLAGAMTMVTTNPIVILATVLLALTLQTMLFRRQFSGTPGRQTAREKVGVLARNTWRLVLGAWDRLLKVPNRCDVCDRRFSAVEGSVWWREEGNSKEHPFLHAPYAFHLGHERCLGQHKDYQSRPSAARARGLPEPTIYKATLPDLLAQHAPRLEAWFADSAEDNARSHGRTGPSRYADEFAHQLERICRVLDARPAGSEGGQTLGSDAAP